MDGDGGRLDQHALVKGHAGDVEEGRAFADFQIGAEVAVEVHFVIREESVNADVFAEACACGSVLAGGAVSAGNDAGDDLVAEPDSASLGVCLDVLADLDDFAGTFVSENNAFCAEPERVALVLMSIGAADAAAFDFDEHFIIVDFRNRVFAEFEFAGFDQHCNCCHFSHFINSSK